MAVRPKTPARKSSVKPKRATPASPPRDDPPPDTTPEGADYRDLLRSTGTPGVFANKMGVLVDASGVALSLSSLRKADAERFEAVLGEVIDTPVKFMRAVTLDPRTPLPIRLDAAKSAAPYTDRKMPTAIEGSTPGSPVAVDLLSGLNSAALSTKERASLIALLTKMSDAAPDDT